MNGMAFRMAVVWSLVLPLGILLGQGRPGGPPPGPAVVSSAFVNVAPGQVSPGSTVTIQGSFRAGVQAPPNQVQPQSATLGEWTASSVSRTGQNVSSVVSIPRGATAGFRKWSVVFPGPNGSRVTFELDLAVLVAAEGTETDPEPVPEPEPDIVPPLPPIPEEPTTVTEPARLSVVTQGQDGSVLIQVAGVTGDTWRLEMTSDFSQWSDAATVVIPDSGVGEVEIPSDGALSTYFRGIAGNGGGASSTGGIYTLFGDGVEVFEDGDFMVLRSTGVPDHTSPYFGVGHLLYAAYDGDNPSFRQNPNGIAEQDLVFRVPKNPSASANPAATRLGPIGVAINGVAFFNQYAGPNNQPLTFEINSFDQHGGHPAPGDLYHYHIEPLFLSGQVGREGFLGVLLDGFPVYGPEENGEEITNADLDEFHGHFGPTADFPDGIYHYHFTDEDPYLNGAGYYGVAGQVTR